MKAQKFTKELQKYTGTYMDFKSFISKVDNIDLTRIRIRVIKYEGRFKQFFRNIGMELDVTFIPRNVICYDYVIKRGSIIIIKGVYGTYKKALQAGIIKTFEYLENQKS